jgi:hypothetical protein
MQSEKQTYLDTLSINHRIVFALGGKFSSVDGAYFVVDWRGKRGAGCSYGHAMYNAGIPDFENDFNELTVLCGANKLSYTIDYDPYTNSHHAGVTILNFRTFSIYSHRHEKATVALALCVRDALEAALGGDA